MISTAIEAIISPTMDVPLLLKGRNTKKYIKTATKPDVRKAIGNEK